jgi:hypothetical protein
MHIYEKYVYVSKQWKKTSKAITQMNHMYCDYICNIFHSECLGICDKYPLGTVNIIAEQKHSHVCQMTTFLKPW